MFQRPLSSILRSRRKEIGITQRKLADATTISRPRCCQFERGFRTPSIEELRKLNAALRMSSLVLFHAPRPPARALAQLVSAGKRLTPRAKVYLPQSDRSSDIRYRAALRRWPASVRSATLRLSQRPDFELVRYLCERVSLGSADECLHLLGILLKGALPCFASPQSLGHLPHPVVDPEGRFEVGSHLFPCLALNDAFYFFQVSFSTPRILTVDTLVWDDGWYVVEVDGYGHRGEDDADRDRALQIPVVRFNADPSQPDFVVRSDAARSKAMSRY